MQQIAQSSTETTAFERRVLMAFMDMHTRLLNVMVGRNHRALPSEEITLETIEFMRRNFPSVRFDLVEDNDLQVPPNVGVRYLHEQDGDLGQRQGGSAHPRQSDLGLAPLRARHHVAALLRIAARRLSRGG